jgi:hypothetical protein
MKSKLVTFPLTTEEENMANPLTLDANVETEVPGDLFQERSSNT